MGIFVRKAKLENGEGGIRTLDTGINPYNGLANRRFRPLSHLSKKFTFSSETYFQRIYYNKIFNLFLNFCFLLITKRLTFYTSCRAA